tara:strand:+ start:61 stop:510 length:450 start_codon:yes stop_codon:yes gene_type:complete
MNKSIINRNTSYKEIRQKLPNKRKRIFEIIEKHNGITAQEISSRYNYPINQVSGRITELKDLCFIKESGNQLNPFSKTYNTMYSVITNEDEFIELNKKKYIELRSKKDSLVRDYQQALSTYTREYVKNEINKINNKIDKLGSAEIAVLF